MIGVILMLALYTVVLLGGWLIASRLGFRKPLEHVLMTFTFGAAQLVLSIQLLSLFGLLTGGPLLLLNSTITSSAALIIVRRHVQRRADNPHLSRRCLNEIAAAVRKHRSAAAVLTMSLALVIWFVALGFTLLPMTDTYHFAMPLFWKQHATIAPYPACNPRLLAVGFASEALAFPGQLYAGTNAAFTGVSGIAMVLSIWVVIGLARSLGASVPAAVCSGALLIGYGATTFSLIGGSPDLVLAAMWFAASIYLLFASRGEHGIQLPYLGSSVLCLLMGCGTKNVILFHLPWYSIAALLLFRRHLFRKRALLAVVLWSFLGLLCSGVVWNYVSNAVWFGNLRGHKVLSETVARDMTPVAVWTRITRASVSTFLDPTWLPKTLYPPYKEVFRQSVHLLGGQKSLPEDDPFYSLPDESLRPGRGLGLLGAFVFFPGMLAGAVYLFSGCRSHSAHGESRLRLLSLLVVTIGSALTFYALLRTQSIGVTRLMLSCLFVGAPISALILERRFFRIASLLVLIGCISIYSVFSLAMVSRRGGLSGVPWLSQRISMLDRADTSLGAEYEWNGEPPGVISIREPYSPRELFQVVLSRLPDRAVIGLIGNLNTDEYFLFGDKFSNTVVALVDSRAPEFLLEAPLNLDCIVVHGETSFNVPQKYPGFELWLTMQMQGKTVLTAFRRNHLVIQE